MDTITTGGLRSVMGAAARLMAEHRDSLIALDQEAGDGDLGLSMQAGFESLSRLADGMEERDCGKMLMKLGMELNEAAPSSLGTILSVLFMGGGKMVKGLEALDVAALHTFFSSGLDAVMQRAGSRPGERTILDSLCPAADAMEGAPSLSEGLERGLSAARAGAEATKKMRAVHGRAAYRADQLLGQPDGGAIVGSLLIQAFAEGTLA